MVVVLQEDFFGKHNNMSPLYYNPQIEEQFIQSESYLLLEDESYLLLEDNNKIILNG